MTDHDGSFSDFHLLMTQHQQEINDLIDLSDTAILLLNRESFHIVHANIAFLQLFSASSSMLQAYRTEPWLFIDILSQECFKSFLMDPRRNSSQDNGTISLIGLNQRSQKPFDVSAKFLLLGKSVSIAWSPAQTKPHELNSRTGSESPSVRHLDSSIVSPAVSSIASAFSSLRMIIQPLLSRFPETIIPSITDLTSRVEGYFELLQEYLTSDMLPLQSETPLSLSATLPSIISKVSQLTSCQIEFEIDPSLPSFVLVSSDRFSRLMWHFLHRAAANSKLVLSAEKNICPRYIYLDFALHNASHPKFIEPPEVARLRNALGFHLVRSMGGVVAERLDEASRSVYFISLPVLRLPETKLFPDVTLLTYGNSAKTSDEISLFFKQVSVSTLLPTSLSDFTRLIADPTLDYSGFLLHSLDSSQISEIVALIQTSPKWYLPIIAYDLDAFSNLSTLSAILLAPLSLKETSSVLELVYSRPAPTSAEPSSSPVRSSSRKRGTRPVETPPSGDSKRLRSNILPCMPRVLIVEDNPVNQAIVQNILNSLNIESDLADNGEKVISTYCQNPYRYSLILMDTLIYGVDGFQTAESIRAFEAKNDIDPVLIVALTGVGGVDNPLPNARQHALDAGMNDFIPKPIDIPDFCTRITKWLNSSTRKIKPVDDPSMPLTDDENVVKKNPQQSSSLPDLPSTPFPAPSNLEEAQQFLDDTSKRGHALDLSSLQKYQHYPIRHFTLDPPLPWMADLYLSQISKFASWHDSLVSLDLSKAYLLREISFHHLNLFNSLQLIILPQNNLISPEITEILSPLFQKQPNLIIKRNNQN